MINDKNRSLNLGWLNPLADDFHHAIEAERFGHAPLLMGPPGVGKAELADWLARRLLCLQTPKNAPCGVCKSCNLFESQTHPDFFRLQIEEEKTAILIDQVRELTDRIVLTPSIGSRRVGLIHSAERMNTNAANALLKTLEEPAAETWLILISDQPERLPATILSRCQRYLVPLPDQDQALVWLGQACPDEDEANRKLALSLAGGAPQTAADWLNEGELMFGLGIRDHLSALLEDDRSAADEVTAEWQTNPQRSWRWLAHWTQAWMNQTLASQSNDMTAPISNANRLSPAALEILQHCWELSLEGTRLSEKPVRHDWLLQRWLLQWQALSRVRA